MSIDGFIQQEERELAAIREGRTNYPFTTDIPNEEYLPCDKDAPLQAGHRVIPSQGPMVVDRIEGAKCFVRFYDRDGEIRELRWNVEGQGRAADGDKYPCRLKQPPYQKED